MDIELVKDALKLDATASDTEVLSRIAQLWEAAGEEVKEPPELPLIRAGQHEQVALNPDGSITVTLAYPVKIAHEVWTEFTFRRPKFKDIRNATKAGDELAVSSALMCALSNQTARVIEDMDSTDAGLCSIVCRFLQQKLPRTGGS